MAEPTDPPSGEEQIRDDIEGAEPVERDPPEVAAAGPCPVTPLGSNQGTYFYLSAKGEFRHLSYRNHSDAGIASLFDDRIGWLWDRYPKWGRGDEPKKVGWLTNAAREYLFKACARRGFFAPDRALRGPGAWRTADGQGLIVHCGDVLILGGRSKPTGTILDGVIYPAGPAEARPAKKAASAEDAAALLRFLSSWSWLRPAHAPRILLGWTAAAMIAGALTWRPHVQLTGGVGTGKSSLDRLIKGLLGSLPLHVSAPTEASVRQALAGSARPVLVDEMETEDLVRARRVVELSRLGSTDGQAPVTRGSPEGRVTQWPIRACFLFSAILHIRFRPQDLSRICILELAELADGGRPKDEVDADVDGHAKTGAALRRRMIDGWDRLQPNIRRYAAEIGRRGHGSRTADQMATILGCAEVLLRDDVVPVDAAAEIVEAFSELDELRARPEEADHAECLTWLLSASVPTGSDKRMRTIGELIERSEGNERSEDTDELRRHGVTIRVSGRTGLTCVIVAANHRGLEAIYNGSRWASGTWFVALKRVPEAWTERDMVRFAGTRGRGTWFWFCDLPLDEGIVAKVRDRDAAAADRAGPGR